MKRIDIITSQNVKIEYKAANVFERFLAWLLDMVFISAASGILFLILLLIQSFLSEEKPWLFFFTSLIPILYHLLFEIFNGGASLGKRILSLRVLKLTNEPIRISDYIMRWAFRMIDITASLGVISIITIVSSPRNQRIGDFLANTTVIKITKFDRMSLHRLAELDSLKDYVPVYPEVASFSEQDMLIIKDVIDRNIKYPGEGSKKALQLTIDKVENILGIKANKRDLNFLRTLIKDYVTLTR